VTDAINSLLLWGITEANATTIAELCKQASEGALPEDIAAAWSKVADLRLDTIVGSSHLISDVGSLIEEALNILDEKCRDVFIRRLPVEQRETLEEIAATYGTTPQSVRYLAEKAARQIRSLLSTDRRFAPVAWRIDAMRRRLGLGIPYKNGFFQAAVTCAATSRNEERDTLVRNLLLWLAGPYELDRETGWLVNGNLPDHSFLRQFTDSWGVIDMDGLRLALASEGLVPEAREHWITGVGSIRMIEGIAVTWQGNAADKAAIVLECLQRPASPEEINHQIGEGHDGQALRNRILGDDRFCRIDQARVALRKWNLEEYTGITEQICLAIDRAGGAIPVADLIRDLGAKFGVREHSVRSRLYAPLFFHEGESVRRRTTADGFDITQTVTDVRGFYVLSDREACLLVPVTRDVLRGSGTPFPAAVAIWLGVEPGHRRPFRCGESTCVLSWLESANSGPSLGSIREVANRHNVGECDMLRFRFDREEEDVEVSSIRSNDLKNLTRTERLSILTGLSVTGDSAFDRDVVSRAIVLQGEDLSPVAALRARGDHLVADLIEVRKCERSLPHGLSDVPTPSILRRGTRPSVVIQ